MKRVGWFNINDGVDERKGVEFNENVRVGEEAIGHNGS